MRGGWIGGILGKKKLVALVLGMSGCVGSALCICHVSFGGRRRLIARGWTTWMQHVPDENPNQCVCIKMTCDEKAGGNDNGPRLEEWKRTVSVRINRGPDIFHFVNTATFRTSLHRVFNSHLVSPIRTAFYHSDKMVTVWNTRLE